MPRSSTTTFKHHHVVVLLLALLALLAFAPGRAAAEDTGPLVSNGTVTPDHLPADGGQVTIMVDAIDDIGIFMMYAEVFEPNGDHPSVQMGFAGNDNYWGWYNVPPNTTEESQTYYITITGTDTNGQFASTTAGPIIVDAAEPPPFDEAPTVFDPVVTPRALPTAGGTVTIRAKASDDRSVASTSATIALPGGGSADVTLEPISSNEFEGTFVAPANATATAAQYGVTIRASDDIGQEGSVDAGTFTVAAKPPPPPPAPVLGKLKAWPGSLSFGRVALGRHERQVVVVQNTGTKNSKPVTGVASVSGAGFSLVGGSALRLTPGQVKTYTVDFRPGSLGAKKGTLKLHRTDGGKPDLTIALAGQGVRR